MENHSYFRQCREDHFRDYLIVNRDEDVTRNEIGCPKKPPDQHLFFGANWLHLRGLS